MSLQMFSEIGWDGVHLCTNCKRVETRYGALACEFRCELKPISAPCYAQLTQVKPDAADEQIQPQENDEMFPEIREEEEVVAMRLLVSYKIPKDDYLENPFCPTGSASAI